MRFVSVSGITAVLAAIVITAVSGCAHTGSPNGFVRMKADEAASAGVVAFERGDMRAALDRFTESLRMNRSIDNREAEARDLVNIARVLAALDHSAAAKGHLDEAITLASAMKDSAAILSEAHATHAKVSYIAGDAVAALAHIDEAFALDPAAASSGAWLNLKGQILASAGRTEEAKAALMRAMEVNTGRKDARETANTHRALSAIEALRGEHGLALAHLESAYELDRAHGSPARIALDLKLIADIKISGGSTKDAIYLYERSYIVGLSGGAIVVAVQSIDRLIDAYAGLGDEDRAAYYAAMKKGILAGAEAQPGGLK